MNIPIGKTFIINVDVLPMGTFTADLLSTLRGDFHILD